MGASPYIIPGIVNKAELIEMTDCYWANVLRKEVDIFLKSHVLPFGMYEKTKYTLHLKSRLEPTCYFFTTTRYSEKQSVELLIKKASQFCTKVRFWIYKEQKGVRELIYFKNNLTNDN